MNTEKNSKVSISNSYYINSDASSPINGTYTNLDCLALTPSLLKLIAEDLGGGFIKNSDINLNDGYPIFTWQIKGDVNGDGVFNKLDVVILQKWLLGDKNAELKNWKNADLYEDNRLDSFDLVIMKKQLIGQ